MDAVVAGQIVVGGTALGSAVIAGLLSPLVLSKLERRHLSAREEAAQKRVDSAEMGAVIIEFLDVLLDQHRSNTDDHLVTKKTMMVGLRFGLLLDQVNQPIAVMISSASSKIANNDERAPAILSSLSSVLPAWHRGLLTAREALLNYWEGSGDPAPVADLPSQ